MRRARAFLQTDRAGVILLNVLFIVAVSATVVMLMITAQDVAVDRTLRLREAAQASAYARAGELSARVALKRDAIQAPGVDHPREPWADVEDEDVAIAGGRFSLRVTDAQGRFNINSLIGGNVTALARLSAILAAAGLSPDMLAPIATYVRFAGPVADVDQLALVMSPQQQAALSAYVTALPLDTAVNINTADERMLAVLFNPVAARLLMTTREQRGYLTQQDLAGASVILPAGAGYTSDFYIVETDVTVGDTHQRLVSGLMRRRTETGVEVLAYTRTRTAPGAIQPASNRD